MGTYYDRKKSENGRIAEEANLLEPELITRIHEEYLEQGARLIRTNTFAANHAMALGRGVRDRREQDAYVKHVIRAAWKLAQKAAENRPEEIFVAADIGPAAENLFSEYETDPAAEYRFLADCFLECGAQIFNFETFSDIKYVAKTARYIKEKCPEAFVMVSFAAKSITVILRRESASAACLPRRRRHRKSTATDATVCWGQSHMYQTDQSTESLPGTSLSRYLPNSGYQQIVRGQAGHADGVHYFADKMEQMAELGVNIIGGCCGTTPKHIRMLCEKLAGKAPYEKLPVVEKGGEDAVSQTRNNSFMAKLQRGEKVIAVELDPPFNQDAQKLMEGAFQLKQSGVDIITIADSPLARARADSVLLAAKVGAMVDIPVMPHIACRDRNRISMHSTLLGAHINGIRNLMIVTGDPVPSGERDNTKSVFDFNSIRFMEYVKELNQEIFLQDAFSYGGALNQNQANEDQVMKRMQKKIDAGLSWFMTQPIYSDEEVENGR